MKPAPDDERWGLGPCAACGHDPACGFASISDADGERWLCHCDDHTCYTPALLARSLGAERVVPLGAEVKGLLDLLHLRDRVSRGGTDERSN